MRVIAYVRNERRELVDDNWDDVLSTVELADDVPTVSLQGLEEFSHVEIIFFAQLAEDVPPGPWHRHPRGNPRWPTWESSRSATRTARIDSCCPSPRWNESMRARWSFEDSMRSMTRPYSISNPSIPGAGPEANFGSLPGVKTSGRTTSNRRLVARLDPLSHFVACRTRRGNLAG